MQEKYGEDAVVLEMNDQYYNMLEKIEPVREIVDIAYEAMKSLDIEPNIHPIRGGTDGSNYHIWDYRRRIFSLVVKTITVNLSMFR